MESSEMKEGETLEVICRSIYLSCNTDSRDQVPTSKLIEFVKPYLEKHPSALRSLQADMDPEGTDIGVPYQMFLEKMSMWVEKILDSHENNETLNQTTCNLDEHLCFAQSTPRRTLRSKPKFFNITYSGSSEEELGDTKEANCRSESLSDEIKMIERVTYQKNKALSENELLKIQVATAEEQIEKLQADLDRYRMRLTHEQSLNELLKKDQIDEIKEENNKHNQTIETYIKKVQEYERDNLYINSLNKQLESENTKLLQNCENLEVENQSMRVEIEELKTVIECKNEELSDVMKQKVELEEELKHKIFLNNDLKDENEFLDHQKVTLERQLSFNTRPMSPILNASQRDRSCIPVYSVNKQHQKLTQLRYSYPMKMTKNGDERLNSSLPTKLNESVDAPYNCYRFPVASGRDLTESFMLSTSLTDQSMKLKGHPQVSLQVELIEAQGPTSDDFHKNKVLELREQLHQVEKRCQDLKEEYDAYKREVTEHNNISNVDILEEMERLKQLCNAYKETIDNISKSNAELENTVKQNKVNSDLLVQFQNKISSLQNEIQLKTKKIQFLHGKATIHKRKIVITRNDLQECKMLTKELKDQNEQLRKEYEEKLQRHDKLVGELEMKNQQILQLSLELQVQRSNNNIGIKEALKEIARQKELIEDLNIKIKELTEREEILVGNQNYESIITNQIEQLAMRAEELNSVKKLYEEALKEIASQKELIEDLNIKIKEFTKREEILVGNQNYKSIVTNQIEQLATRAQELNSLKKLYEEQITNLSKQLVDTRQKLDGNKQKYEVETANQTMALAKTKEEFSVREQNYEQTIANQARQLAETTNELAEAKRELNALKQNYDTLIASHTLELEEQKKKFNALKQNYEENIARQGVVISEDDKLTQSEVHPVNISQKKNCDFQEDNNCRWITHSVMITIFVLMFIYWSYQGNICDQVCLFNFIKKIHIGNPPS